MLINNQILDTKILQAALEASRFRHLHLLNRQIIALLLESISINQDRTMGKTNNSVIPSNNSYDLLAPEKSLCQVYLSYFVQEGAINKRVNDHTWKVEMMDPIEMESMNWARKTMLLTIPTSVPIPLGISSCFRSSEY